MTLLNSYILYYKDTGEIFTSRSMNLTTKRIYERAHPSIDMMEGSIAQNKIHLYKVDVSQTPPVLIESNYVHDPWPEIRYKRDTLLLSSDWTHGADSPLSESKRAEWAAYRQALRDITNQSDPANIVWPTKP